MYAAGPQQRLLGHFRVDTRRNDAQKGLQNRLSRVPAYFSTREFGRCVCRYAPAKPASASKEVVVLPLAEASAEHKRGLWAFSTTRPRDPHPFKAIRHDLVEFRQELRAHVAALNSSIDSLDARFTSHNDARY